MSRAETRKLLRLVGVRQPPEGRARRGSSRRRRPGAACRPGPRRPAGRAVSWSSPSASSASGTTSGHRVAPAHLVEQPGVLLAPAALEQLARLGGRTRRRRSRPCSPDDARPAGRRSAGRPGSRGGRPRSSRSGPAAARRSAACSRISTASRGRPASSWTSASSEPRLEPVAVGPADPRGGLAGPAPPRRTRFARAGLRRRAASAAGTGGRGRRRPAATPSIVSDGRAFARGLLVGLQGQLVAAHRLGGLGQPVVGRRLLGRPGDLVAVALDQPAVLAEDDQGVGSGRRSGSRRRRPGCPRSSGRSPELDRRLGAAGRCAGRGPGSRSGSASRSGRRPAGPGRSPRGPCRSRARRGPACRS